jgi:C4-dicarboxylate-specific signal transduction histidine kinase
VAKAEEDSLFMAGKAKWLLDNLEQLSPDQRALLLAVANLDMQSGRKLSAEEQRALDELSSKAEGYDPGEIERAVKYMVEAKAKRKVVDWPSGLWRKVRKKK